MKLTYTDGAFALVVRPDRSFLLTNTHFKTGDYWSIPGGVVEPHETPAQAAVREVQEETGITCKVTNLLHTVDITTTKDLRLSFYSAEYIGGNINIDEAEIESAEWFHESDLERLDFAYANTLQTIQQALDIRTVKNPHNLSSN